MEDRASTAIYLPGSLENIRRACAFGGQRESRTGQCHITKSTTTQTTQANMYMYVYVNTHETHKRTLL